MFVLSCAIVLALVAVPVEGRGRHACCYPTIMEGAQYYLGQEEPAQRYFVADYNRGYIFETAEMGAPNKTLIDLFNKKVYSIEGEKCREVPVRDPVLLHPCHFKEDAWRYIDLGDGDKSIIDVDLHNYKFGPFSVSMAVQYASDGCFPVAAQTTIGGHSLTTLYEITYREIAYHGMFSDLEKCNVDVRGEGAEGGSSRSSNDEED